MMKISINHIKVTTSLLVFFLFISSCRKEELIPSAVNDLEFYCPEEKSELFFEGELGGKPFCYYDGVEDYEFKFLTAVDFVTISPQVTINPDSLGNSTSIQDTRKWISWGFWPQAVFQNSPVGDFPELSPFINIQSPASPLENSRSDIVRQYLQDEVPLTIQSDQILSNQGFNISFQFINPKNNGTEVFTARGGNQDGSYLRITDLEIRPLPDGSEQYDVTFELECKLYYYGEPHRFYNILSGTMRAVFVIK